MKDSDEYPQNVTPFVPIPAIEAYKPGIDRGLLIESLRLTPQQRFGRHEAMLRDIKVILEAAIIARPKSTSPARDRT